MANSGKGLAGVVGVAAAALLMTIVPQFEGTKLKPYRDVAGVWTVCTGDTNNVDPKAVETREGCKRRLETRLIEHSEGVLSCTPGLKDKPYPLAAASSLAYNIGVPAYCRSTVAKRFNAGDVRGGCNAFLSWNKAGGKVVKGLVIRRQKERDICLHKD